MKKLAFRSVSGKIRHGKRILQTNPFLRKALIGGALGGTADVAFTHSANKLEDKRLKSKYKKNPKLKLRKQKEHKVNLGIGAVGGTLLGATLGGRIGLEDMTARQSNKFFKNFKSRHNRRRQSQYEDWEDFFGFGRSGRGRTSSGGEARSANVPNMGTPEWLKGIKTKADAKKVFRQHAMKHHPDRGGDPEKMKKLNVEWESFQKHHFHKLSHVSVTSFVDELNHIYGR